MNTRREELVEKALNDLLEHGVAGMTLRPLAARIGTSARLLVYHFGSKDGLITAVMDDVQARIQNSFASALDSTARKPARSVMQAFWAWTIHPANVGYLRLVYEVQVLAIQNPAVYGTYLKGTSSSWLDLIGASLPPSEQNRTIVTLCIAVIDGLLLEFMSTGDRGRTTEALKFFDDMVTGGAQDA